MVFRMFTTSTAAVHAFGKTYRRSTGVPCIECGSDSIMLTNEISVSPGDEFKNARRIGTLCPDCGRRSIFPIMDHPELEVVELLCGIYQHYKGEYYELLLIAHHHETMEKYVVYIPLYMREGPRAAVRPLDSFTERVQWPDGLMRPRFTYVGVELPPELLKPHEDTTRAVLRSGYSISSGDTRSDTIDY